MSLYVARHRETVRGSVREDIRRVVEPLRERLGDAPSKRSHQFGSMKVFSKNSNEKRETKERVRNFVVAEQHQRLRNYRAAAGWSPTHEMNCFSVQVRRVRTFR